MLNAERSASGDEEAAPERTPTTLEPGRVWVTREGVFVDRIASAWLIRRFIDPKARFKFISGRGYSPKSNEVRFDMVGGDFTHVGEHCTFQTLVEQFALDDRALRAIGEVVHDIDCKDEKYGRAETAGIFGLLRGISEATTDDQERLARGQTVFDDLYAFYSGRRGQS